MLAVYCKQQTKTTVNSIYLFKYDICMSSYSISYEYNSDLTNTNALIMRKMKLFLSSFMHYVIKKSLLILVEQINIEILQE